MDQISFTFWVNDRPALVVTAPDTGMVNGSADLAGFFPVSLSIRELVKVLPPSDSVKYYLSQADETLRFTYTKLDRSTAFSYKTGPTAGFGPSFDQPASTAPTEAITADGVELSADFLANIRDHDQGVLLVTARAAATEPLVLTVEKDGVTVAQVELPLSVRPRIVLLLHGMNSNTATWDALRDYAFGGSATDIVNGNFTTSAPNLTIYGVRCYRLQFGFYDAGSTRAGLVDIVSGNIVTMTAGSTPGYLSSVATDRCGDFETFDELGQEVNDAIKLLLNQHHGAEILLVGHSRGGLAARAFLESSNSNYAADQAAVVGLLTTSSPHLGSPMGRIYHWLATHQRGAAGTDAADWSTVDFLRTPTYLGISHVTLDVRRPVISDMTNGSAALTALNDPAAVANLPADIRYGEIVYDNADLGYLTQSYSVFTGDIPLITPPMSPTATAYILGPQHTPADYHGDGLVPGWRQVFTQMYGFSGVKIARRIVRNDTVVHTEAPGRKFDLVFELQLLKSDWIP